MKSDGISEGCSLLDRALAGAQRGLFQLQAAISALHAQSSSHAETGWQEIVMLYDTMHALSPNSGVPAQPRRGAILLLW